MITMAEQNSKWTDNKRIPKFHPDCEFSAHIGDQDDEDGDHKKIIIAKIIICTTQCT